MRSSMKVGKAWQVRDVTVEDWVDIASALELHPELALDRVESLRTRLPDAVAEAADTAPLAFKKDAHRLAAAVGRQRHLHVPRLPHARR